MKQEDSSFAKARRAADEAAQANTASSRTADAGRAASGCVAASAPDAGRAASNELGAGAPGRHGAGTAATVALGCAPAVDVDMRYVSPAEVKASLDAGDGAWLVVDVRKGADYEAGHLPTAVSVDVDAAKRGDYAAGTRAVRAGMREATGSENGGGARIVLVCYSGRRCAQAATNILSDLGAPLDKVFTMEGGMKAWQAAYPDAIEVW